MRTKGSDGGGTGDATGVRRPWDALSTHRPVGATANLRDLGGIPAGGGLVVAPARVYRAEALVRPGTAPLCTPWEAGHTEAYRALGVRTVLDLRSRAEIDRAASAWAEATGAVYVALPIEEGGEGDTDYVREIRTGLRSAFTPADMAAYYALTLRRRADEFGAGLRILADPARLPVLVHCAAGKDRTGLLVALLLEALRVPREVVVADYALTEVLRPDRVQAYAHLFEGTGVDLADVATLFASPAEAMDEALADLDAEFGSVEGYLTARCGLTPSDLTSLRTALLVPTPS
ncbi:tyrosine-protein phosphatase [Pseudonocardia pini]|uniref:tyrosine-protein phosphatase n=1 Tax=Pseudonocardia pini TaxID=2758030 RepID=UPI0015F0B8D9|nr:tyrosine-protein phosphatase [Pseudonocardia pini]